ncbi:MAG: hypothetical protein JWQ97_1189 [Phenylobacterium sp.]|nr:hypothetical protein [Phenylobacterium sp.]
MRTFTCLFEDSRYGVPTLSFYLTIDEQRARDLALRDLAVNAHYRAAEVSEGGRHVFSLTEQDVARRSGWRAEP